MKKFRIMFVLVVVLATILAACHPAPTAPVIEKEVIKTVEVEKIVVETKEVEKIVEKIVEATPLPSELWAAEDVTTATSCSSLFHKPSILSLSTC